MGKFSDKIKEIFEDIATLKVVTYTGSADVTAKKSPVSALDNFAISLTHDDKSKISVVAWTEIKLDGDVNQLYSSIENSELRELHNKAVETGADIRRGYLELAKSIIG